MGNLECDPNAYGRSGGEFETVLDLASVRGRVHEYPFRNPGQSDRRPASGFPRRKCCHRKLPSYIPGSEPNPGFPKIELLKRTFLFLFAPLMVPGRILLRLEQN